MIITKIKAHQNGQNAIDVILWEIDSSKPPVQLVGHHYEFNSRILNRVTLTQKQIFGEKR